MAYPAAAMRACNTGPFSSTSTATGHFAAGDPYVITDSAGTLRLHRAGPGHLHGRHRPAGRLPRDGTRAATFKVTITTDGTAITGKNFGEFLPLPDLTTSAVSFTPAERPRRRPAGHGHMDRDEPGQRPGRGELGRRRLPVADADPGRRRPAADDSRRTTAAWPRASRTPARPRWRFRPCSGTFYVIVQADDRNQVFEGPFGANQSAKIAASAVTLTITVRRCSPLASPRAAN